MPHGNLTVVVTSTFPVPSPVNLPLSKERSPVAPEMSVAAESFFFECRRESGVGVCSVGGDIDSAVELGRDVFTFEGDGDVLGIGEDVAGDDLVGLGVECDRGSGSAGAVTSVADLPATAGRRAEVEGACSDHSVASVRFVGPECDGACTADEECDADAACDECLCGFLQCQS